MVRMSSVSVPDPGEKIRLGARIIVAPTATRAAATIAKIEVDAWGLLAHHGSTLPTLCGSESRMRGCGPGSQML